MAKDKVYTADMGQVPQDVDGASAGRPYKKNEKNVPEQPGSGISVKKLAKGGTASARADGCATKGKTKGTMIAMCGGGYAKGKK
jgi:hypothetical protein